MFLRGKIKTVAVALLFYWIYLEHDAKPAGGPTPTVKSTWAEAVLKCQKAAPALTWSATRQTCDLMALQPLHRTGHISGRWSPLMHKAFRLSDGRVTAQFDGLLPVL